MSSTGNISRLLGPAFLIQGVASLVGGIVFKSALMVSGNISETMTNIVNNATLMRANILVEMITYMGIIFLGAVLFTTLKHQNKNIALVALGFYILEAALGTYGSLQGFSLMRISQEWVAAGHPGNLQALAQVSYDAMDFGGMTLHMLAFSVGAILFYYLLDKARIVPRVLSLWGLITVFPCLVGTLLTLFGYDVSMWVFAPYIPFEFIIGVWILVKGVKQPEPLSVANI